MCRNIKTLSNFEPPASNEEIRASAQQYVKKLSGAGQPSKQNQAAFDQAVTRVEAATKDLLEALVIQSPPRNRELEAAKARKKAEKRFSSQST